LPRQDAEKIFAQRLSGAVTDRSALRKALEFASSGDTLMANPDIPVIQIAQRLGVSPATLYGTSPPHEPRILLAFDNGRVRRAKAALSSGCKPHPAIRSSRKQSEQSWR
jgi:hypothetical protein